MAGDGGAVTWPALTSLLKVKQYLLTGDRMPAREALAIGMANFVVPPGELLDAATAFAWRLAGLPPQAVQDTKLVLNQGLRERAASVLPFGLAAESQSSDTAEYADVPARFEAERAARSAATDPDRYGRMLPFNLPELTGEIVVSSGKLRRSSGAGNEPGWNHRGAAGRWRGV